MKHSPDSGPNLTRYRVESSDCPHLGKPDPGFHHSRLALPMHADLINEAELILDSGHVQGPLGVTVCISDRTKPSDNSETQKENLQLPQQPLTCGPEVDPDVT